MGKAKERMRKAKERTGKAKESPSPRTQAGSDDGTLLPVLAGRHVGVLQTAHQGHLVPADVAPESLSCSRGEKTR